MFGFGFSLPWVAIYSISTAAAPESGGGGIGSPIGLLLLLTKVS